MLAYAVASVSGSVLAVCSCTVLPLFAGIYRRGAGLGPATAFLYSGPAINVLAIILTARLLGVRLGVARAVGAVVFSVVVGLLMQLIFRKEETQKAEQQMALPEETPARPLWQTAVMFALMVGILVAANFAAPQGDAGLWSTIHAAKWPITGVLAVAFAVTLVAWIRLAWWKAAIAAAVVLAASLLAPGMPVVAFAAGSIALALITAAGNDESTEWFDQSWSFGRQILPLLLGGVMVAGLLLGRTHEGAGHEGLVPRQWIETALGGNSLRANLLASVAGALMYFATLTEVPIVAGLRHAGMGEGPVLALPLPVRRSACRTCSSFAASWARPGRWSTLCWWSSWRRSRD